MSKLVAHHEASQKHKRLSANHSSSYFPVKKHTMFQFDNNNADFIVGFMLCFFAKVGQLTGALILKKSH